MTHNTRRLTENAAGIPAGLQSRDTISDERLACPRPRLTNAARGDKTRSAAMRPSVKLLWTLACSSCRPAGRGRDADARRGVGSHGADAESSVSTAAGYSSPVDVRLHSVLCLANRSAPSSFGQYTTLTYSKKGKVFPYSLPSGGPGADPGVQAVSPQVT